MSKKAVENAGARCAIATHFAKGGEGAIELATLVKEAAEEKNNFHFLYPLTMKLRERVETIAKVVYGAAGVSWSPEGRGQGQEVRGRPAV